MNRCGCGRVIAGGYDSCFWCHLKSHDLVRFKGDRRNFSDINYWEWANAQKRVYDKEMALNVEAERT